MYSKICIQEYTYKMCSFSQKFMDKKFCFYVMLKKSVISMIRLFKTLICCPPKCHNSHIDAVMLIKFLSEGVGGSISSRTVLCFHSFCLGCQVMQVLWHNNFLLVKIYCYLSNLIWILDFSLRICPKNSCYCV